MLFKNPLRDENVKAVVLERAVAPVDTDKDGRISLTEFLEDWREKVSSEIELIILALFKITLSENSSPTVF